MSPPSTNQLPRRTFLTYSIVAGLSADRLFAAAAVSTSSAGGPVVNAFSPIKQKLAAGESATLLIISDSTGYREDSGVRRFLRSLPAQYPAHRMIE